MSPASTRRRCQPAPTTGPRQPSSARRAAWRPGRSPVGPRDPPARSAADRAGARRWGPESPISECRLRTIASVIGQAGESVLRDRTEANGIIGEDISGWPPPRCEVASRTGGRCAARVPERQLRAAEPDRRTARMKRRPERNRVGRLGAADLDLTVACEPPGPAFSGPLGVSVLDHPAGRRPCQWRFCPELIPTPRRTFAGCPLPTGNLVSILVSVGGRVRPQGRPAHGRRGSTRCRQRRPSGGPRGCGCDGRSGRSGSSRCGHVVRGAGRIGWVGCGEAAAVVVRGARGAGARRASRPGSPVFLPTDGPPSAVEGCQRRAGLGGRRFGVRVRAGGVRWARLVMPVARWVWASGQAKLVMVAGSATRPWV